MKALAALILALAAVTALGQSPNLDSSVSILMGTWDGDGGAPLTIEFTREGVAYVTTQVQDSKTLTVEANYSFDGGSLILRAVDGKYTSSNPAERKSLERESRALKWLFKNSPADIIQIHWTDRDDITLDCKYPLDGSAKTDTLKRRSIVGTWTTSDPGTGGQIEFKANGAVVIGGVTPTKLELPPYTTEVSFSYRLDGDMLTIRPATMKVTVPEGASDAIKKAAQRMNTMTSQALTKASMPATRVKWIDKNTFILGAKSLGDKTGPRPSTFKRR